jgi:hypothetical protein
MVHTHCAVGSSHPRNCINAPYAAAVAAVAAVAPAPAPAAG